MPRWTTPPSQRLLMLSDKYNNVFIQTAGEIFRQRTGDPRCGIQMLAPSLSCTPSCLRFRIDSALTRR